MYTTKALIWMIFTFFRSNVTWILVNARINISAKPLPLLYLYIVVYWCLNQNDEEFFLQYLLLRIMLITVIIFEIHY